MPRRRREIATTSRSSSNIEKDSVHMKPTKQSTPTTQPQPAKTPTKKYHPRIVKKPTLSRHQIAADLAVALGLSAHKARYVLDTVLQAIKARVRAGHDVELRGLVKFSVRNVKARERIDMVDVKAGLKGAAVRRFTVPAHAVVKATASPRFLGEV